MGKRGDYSQNAARIAVKKGYQQVYWFFGGIPEWRDFNYTMFVDKDWQRIRVKMIPPKTFNVLLNGEKICHLDVRPQNYKRNRFFIKDSIICPLMDLETFFPNIEKDRFILVSDVAMQQSISAAKFLIKNKYSVIGVLKGGIERWMSERYPVEKRGS